MDHHDELFMAQALALARNGRGTTSPNPMVGALIVKGDTVIAEGWHKKCGGPHAERIALDVAGSRARGARLYVTLEPCNHQGRTPPCVDAVIKSGVSEVVIAMKDPNPLTNGKSIKKLQKAGITVRTGVLAHEARRLNEAFLKYITTGMPFVVAKSAQTLDGKIATASGRSQWITSDATRQYARRLRDDFDAIMVGSATVIADDPRLTASAKTKKLKKIIVDSTLRVPLTARVFTLNPTLCIVATTKRASAQKKAVFLRRGVEVIVCPSVAGKVDLKWLFKALAKQEIMSILLEGGAHLMGSALSKNLVDKMQIYIAPRIMGDEKALSAVVGPSVKRLDMMQRLTDITIQFINTDMMVTGYVLRDR